MVLVDALTSDSAVTAPGNDFTTNGAGIGLLIGGTAQIPAVLDVYDTTAPPALDAQGNPQLDPDALLTRFFLPSFPKSVEIASGLAYVADGNAGLVVANYKQFDSGGVAPAITIDTSFDADPDVEGIQVEEGKSLPISITASDIGDGTIDPSDDAQRLARLGQIRNVELIVDGQIVRNDVSFPFEDFFARAPKLSKETVTVQVRATDTGGNVTLSKPFLLTPVDSEAPITVGLDIDVVADTFAPVVQQTTPPNGDIRGKNFRTLRVGFSETMDEATLSATMLR